MLFNCTNPDELRLVALTNDQRLWLQSLARDAASRQRDEKRRAAMADAAFALDTDCPHMPLSQVLGVPGLDDKTAGAVGDELAELVGLRHTFGRTDRYDMQGGNKTAAGVARTVARVFDEVMDRACRAARREARLFDEAPGSRS